MFEFLKILIRTGKFLNLVLTTDVDPDVYVHMSSLGHKELIY